MMFWKTKIRVTYVDEATGKTVAFTDSPPEALPETFAIDTTLEMLSQKWDVVKAEPQTRAEAKAAGRLTLTLRKSQPVQKIPLGDMLYSLPTICDFIPGLEAGSILEGKNILVIHEDDWRQIEFVSADLLEEVRACLGKIERIYRESRVKSGFKEVYVRKELAAPLAHRHLERSSLDVLLKTPLEAFAGVTYRGATQLIKEGFALRDAHPLMVFGTLEDENFNALCLSPIRSGLFSQDDINRWAEFLKSHRLVLVDWCQLMVALDAGGLSAYFNQK